MKHTVIAPSLEILETCIASSAEKCHLVGINRATRRAVFAHCGVDLISLWHSLGAMVVEGNLLNEED